MLAGTAPVFWMRLASGDLPCPRREVRSRLLHLEENARANDRGVDLGPCADDAGILHQSLHVRLAKARHFRRVEPWKAAERPRACAAP